MKLIGIGFVYMAAFMMFSILLTSFFHLMFPALGWLNADQVYSVHMASLAGLAVIAVAGGIERMGGSNDVD